MNDLLIKNAYLIEYDNILDIAIKGGKIVEVKKDINVKGFHNVIDANGRLVSPGLVDSHTHLEKSLTIDGTESCTLVEAIQTFEKRCENISEEDIKDRSRRVLDMAIKNGTTAMRTHTLVDQHIKLMGIKAISELKEEYAHLIDLQIVAMAPVEGETINQKNIQLLDEASKYNIDLYGGSPSLSVNPKEQIDAMFELAKKNNLDLDFHSDETDQPVVSALEYLAEKTINENMQGRVTGGHCVALGYILKEEAQPIIQKVKDAKMSIITLPSCNLYLMGRDDNHPMTRGLTRVKEFLEAGVNITFASDNIQDPFRPFGNADMLEEALFTSQVLQMGTISQLNLIFDMATYKAAKALGLKDYGVAPGCNADLVIFDAKTADEAIVTQANRAYVIKSGKVIIRNKKETIVNYN